MKTAECSGPVCVERTDPRGRNSRLTGLVSGILALGLFHSGPVAAADEGEGAKAAGDDSRLQEIVVVARRREESLAKVATSVSVISGEDIVQNGISGMNDYFLSTPNVSIKETGTRDENFIAMRGVSNVGFGQTNTSFAFYFNEFNVGLFTSNLQLQDIARIEVLRGPQGTYFGRNSAGGAINVMGNRPGPKLEARGALGFSRFNTFDVDGMVNVPVSDKLLLRGVAAYHTSDGYVENVNAVGGTSAERYINGRLGIRLLATERLTFDLDVMRTEENIDMRALVATHQIPPNETFIAARNPPGTAITDGLDPYPLNTRLVNENAPKPSERNYTIGIGRIEYDTDSFSITSITGAGRSRRFSTGGGEATSYDIVTVEDDLHQDLWGTELRLASLHSGNRFDWSIGAIYSKQKSESRTNVRTGPDIGQIVLPVPPNFTLINNREAFLEQTSRAVFGEVDWNVNDRLTLTLGGRYTQDTDERYQTDRLGAVLTYPLVSADFSQFTPRFAGTYKVNDDLSLYGVASQGYKSGGNTLGAPAGLTSFKPETLWNYELGVRGYLLGGKARYSLSAFHIDWTDLQVSTLTTTVGPGGNAVTIVAFQNAASAKSSGAELETVFAPLPGLEIGMTAGWLPSAKFDSFPKAVISGLPGSIDLSGQRLLEAPQWTLGAHGQYNFRVGEADAYVRAEWSYIDDKKSDLRIYFPEASLPANRPDIGVSVLAIPSYSVTNLRAGVVIGRITADVYVDNAFDKNYYNGIYDSNFASGFGVLVHHRNYGLRFAYKM